ncbi:penicillin-binding protein [Peptococcaceae bacterium SCADC1_2_3]|jgi:penicillin-binding protein 1A|nr:penicillin-binding protein [Peptococcaceae bacterium SCADC1_2_3]
MAAKKRRLNKFRAFVFVLGFLVFIGAGAAFGLFVVSIKDLPVWQENWLSFNTPTVLYDQEEKLIASVGTKNSLPVKIKDIPLQVQQAFIAVEDERFYQHHGIDFQAIARAAWYNLKSGGIYQGASTITQQLVKISFLSAPDALPERTLKRKIQEAILAFLLERRLSKKEILERYLNEIYFGEGAYGIKAAAQTFFAKEPEELNLAETALLAGLPQSPNNYSPFQSPSRAIKRRDQVLQAMLKNNFIVQKQLEEVKKVSLSQILKPGKRNQYPYPYFVDYVTEQLVKSYGEEMVYKGGLRVYTTLDIHIQKAAEKVLANNNNFPSSVRDGNGIVQPQGAAIILDPQNGCIKALVGGREHTHIRAWNRATRETRLPGSALKPIVVYGPAIELKGLGPASIVDDIPVKYGSFTPHNYDGRYRGLVTLRTALAYSLNVPAVKILMDEVGLPQALSFARALGIPLEDKVQGPSTALGGLHKGVTPLQMAAAYGAFANQGTYFEPAVILKVETSNGKVLYEHQLKPYPVMKPTTAFLVTDMLKSVIVNGTGAKARLNRPAAGKTGTSDLGKDLWFCGYTPELVGVVWIGYDKSKKAMPYEFGGRYPALIWRQIMREALQNSPARDFPRPAGIVTATVDSKSGFLPGPNTPPDHTATDYFIEGTVPTTEDHTHVLVEVCALTGQLANEYCPERVTKMLVKLPYQVPDYVEDYSLRVPPGQCSLHNPFTIFDNEEIRGTLEQEPAF